MLIDISISHNFRHLNIPQFQQVVIDRKVSLREIAKDISTGQMVLHGISRLVLLVGRTDLLNKDDPVWVLERLVQAVKEAQFTGEVVIAGPVPEAHDKLWFCQDMVAAIKKMEKHVK